MMHLKVEITKHKPMNECIFYSWPRNKLPAEDIVARGCALPARRRFHMKRSLMLMPNICSLVSLSGLDEIIL